MNPRLYLRMKYLGECAGVDSLADEGAFGIEKARFGEKGLRLFVLAKKTSLPGLLQQVSDVVLMGDCKRLGVVRISRV